MYRLNLQSVALPVPEILAITQFWVGVANPYNLWEWEAVGAGSGMVGPTVRPKERW